MSEFNPGFAASKVAEREEGGGEEGREKPSERL